MTRKNLVNSCNGHGGEPFGSSLTSVRIEACSTYLVDIMQKILGADVSVPVDSHSKKISCSFFASSSHARSVKNVNIVYHSLLYSRSQFL